MNFLRLRRVRMYAAFRPKYRYIGKALTSRAYIFGHEIKLSEIRKLFAGWQKWFHEIALLRTAYRLHGCAWGCTV